MLVRPIAWLILAIASALQSPAALADTYPAKPIRMVVPWTPGSGADIVGRQIAQKLSEILNQTVFVENRGGASGTIGSAIAARDAPDGYTLILGNSASHGSAKAVYPKLPYDPVADFTPVSLMYKNRLVLAANSAFPANSLAELIAYAKANPGKVSYGTPGEGTPHLLAGETLKLRAGIDIVHVPYKGGGQVMSDLVAGHIQLAVASLSTAADMARNGRIKILASTDNQRIDSLPGVPTLSEVYPGVDIVGWGGLFGPKKLPDPIVKKLNLALQTVLSSNEIKTKLEAVGMEPGASTPEELMASVKGEMERWRVLRVAQ